MTDLDDYLMSALLEMPFIDLIHAYLERTSKNSSAAIDFRAGCRLPVSLDSIDESWPEEIREFYTLCDGFEVDQVADSGIFKLKDLVLGKDLSPKLSVSIKKNIEVFGLEETESLPVITYSGTDSLIKSINDEYDFTIPLVELDNHLILQSDGSCDFLVCFLTDFGPIKKGSVLDIEGEEGTEYKSLKLYLAFFVALFENLENMGTSYSLR